MGKTVIDAFCYISIDEFQMWYATTNSLARLVIKINFFWTRVLNTCSAFPSSNWTTVIEEHRSMSLVLERLTNIVAIRNQPAVVGSDLLEPSHIQATKPSYSLTLLISISLTCSDIPPQWINRCFFLPLISSRNSTVDGSSPSSEENSRFSNLRWPYGLNISTTHPNHVTVSFNLRTTNSPQAVFQLHKLLVIQLYWHSCIFCGTWVPAVGRSPSHKFSPRSSELILHDIWPQLCLVSGLKRLAGSPLQSYRM